jgi:chemotaxis protein methyltransferase CheR
VNARDRDLVADLCARLAGLRVESEKSYVLENRLAPVARREGYGSAHDLAAAVRDRDDERLAWAVVEAMSPAETAFFRDGAALEAAVGDLCSKTGVESSGLRIWVAGCGTGQEAYSIAMLLHERAALTGVELFASDLSERRLEAAQVGLYSQFEVQRGLSARRLVRHFESYEAGFVLSPHLRRSIRWGRANLLDDLSRLGKFDLVVCRRPLGGLLDAARERVIDGLSRALKADGRLMVSATDAAPGLVAQADRPGVYGPGGPVCVAA